MGERQTLKRFAAISDPPSSNWLSDPRTHRQCYSHIKAFSQDRRGLSKISRKDRSVTLVSSPNPNPHLVNPFFLLPRPLLKYPSPLSLVKTHRTTKHRSRSHKLFPRIPVHGRILPRQTPLRHPRLRLHHARNRRIRRPAPQARKSLHIGRKTRCHCQ